MKEPDLVEFFLISLLAMCVVFIVKPDLYMHIQKMDLKMLLNSSASGS